MKTITFFAPKGGSGRTTAVMTTAAALIEAGHRVGVLDMTEQALTAARGGTTFITQWEDAMVASGISAEELTTAPAWDHNSLMVARDHFANAGCTRVLVDTPKKFSDLIKNLFFTSDLIVMPFTSCTEATWISDWTSSNLCLSAAMYGLAMGLTGSEERQAIHRKALHGSPMLKHGLPHIDIFSSQLINGSLYKMTAGHGALPYDETDLVRARASSTALVKELNTRINAKGQMGYPVTEPLAIGHPFAHLHALRALSPEAFC